jgi:hypothetical protein
LINVDKGLLLVVYRPFIAEYPCCFLMVYRPVNLVYELNHGVMKTIMITALILISAICSQAQNKVPASHGFWVVESNINKPKVQTVRFYSDDSKLLYEETVNTKLNLKREKVQLALNQISNKLYENKQYMESKKLIALAFNLKR